MGQTLGQKNGPDSWSEKRSACLKTNTRTIFRYQIVDRKMVLISGQKNGPEFEAEKWYRFLGRKMVLISGPKNGPEFGAEKWYRFLG